MNRTGYTAPDSSTNTYNYDTLNRLSSLANSWAGTFGFSYDALSRRTQMTRPNSITTNYTYDSLSRLLSVLHQAGGSTIDGATYTVDAAGNRTSKQDWLAGVTSNYTYDAIYELTQVTQGSNTTESYNYDPVGNRTASLGVASYTTNSSNELTATSNASYTYDANGNTTSKTTSGNTTSYSWDYENRLSSVTLPGSGGTVSFKYDPFGRRTYKSSSSSTSVYAYDGMNLIEETNLSGGVVARYSQGLDLDEPLAMLRGSATNYYQTDGLGSATSLSSTAGALTQTYGFDSFGRLVNSNGSQTNPFQYTARELDSETGLYYYRTRYYDPLVGRFLGEDPIGFEGGITFYSYAQNDPTDYRDPLGLQSQSGTTTAPPPPITSPPAPPPQPLPVPPSEPPPVIGPEPPAAPVTTPYIGAAILAILQLTVFAPSVDRDEDRLPKKTTPPPCDNNGPDCTKATQFHLNSARISDPHEFKKDFLGRNAPISRYDICACKDGSIIIKARGQCGSPGPGIGTGYKWK